MFKNALIAMAVAAALPSVAFSQSDLVKLPFEGPTVVTDDLSCSHNQKCRCPGPTGPTGPTGPAGSAGVIDSFGSFFTQKTVNPPADPAATVTAGNSFLFDQETIPVSGTAFMHVLGTADFVFIEEGDYAIDYGISLKDTGGNIALTVNGTTVQGSNLNSGAGNQITNCNIILHLNVGDILRLTNIDTGTLQLRAGNAHGPTTAYIVIEKIHD